MATGSTKRLLAQIWAEIRSDPPRLPRPRSWRSVAVALVLVAVAVCCGWLLITTVGSIVGDLAFYLIPLVGMVAIATAAVIGWRTGLLQRWSKTRVAVVALVLVVLTPVVLLVGWFGKLTLDAGKGDAYPVVAVHSYFTYAPFGYTWSRDPAAFSRVLCSDHRTALQKQADQLNTSAHRADRPGSTLGELLVSNLVETSNDGDRATMTGDVQVSLANTNLDRKAGEWMSWRSDPRPWTFQLVNDNGWRVCSIALVDPCEASPAGPAQVDCDPTDNPSVAPSAPARTWDDRVPWRCLPDVPGYWRLKDCATPPADWTAPGPYRCAPDFSLINGPDTVKECHRLGYYYVD